MIKRAAVVVGINYTQFPPGSQADVTARASLNHLRYAEADAADLASVLTSAGYDVAPLSGDKATQRAIIGTIVRQRRLVSHDGLLVVYFAGHGALDPDDPQIAYLLPVDADPENLAGSAIPLDLLVERYVGPVHSALTLLDCCHSGYALGWRGSEDSSARAVAFLDQVETTFHHARGRVVLAACAGDQKARELVELRHGAFTYYALEHWRDYPGEVDSGSLFATVDRALQGRRLPRPVQGGMHEGRLVLREAAGPPPPASASAAPPAALETHPANPQLQGLAGDTGPLGPSTQPAPRPAPGPDTSRPQIVIAAALLLIVGALVILAPLTKPSSKGGPDQTTPSAQVQATTTATVPILSVSVAPSPSPPSPPITSPAPQDPVCAGRPCGSSAGLTIIAAVARAFSNFPGNDLKPEGKIFVRIDLRILNHSDKDLFMGQEQFSLQDARKNMNGTAQEGLFSNCGFGTNGAQVPVLKGEDKAAPESLCYEVYGDEQSPLTLMYSGPLSVTVPLP